MLKPTINPKKKTVSHLSIEDKDHRKKINKLKSEANPTSDCLDAKAKTTRKTLKKLRNLKASSRKAINNRNTLDLVSASLEFQRTTSVDSTTLRSPAYSHLAIGKILDQVEYSHCEF